MKLTRGRSVDLQRVTAEVSLAHLLGFGTFDFESYESSYMPYIKAVTYNVTNGAGMKIGNLHSPLTEIEYTYYGSDHQHGSIETNKSLYLSL